MVRATPACWLVLRSGRSATSTRCDEVVCVCVFSVSREGRTSHRATAREERERGERDFGTQPFRCKLRAVLQVSCQHDAWQLVHASAFQFGHDTRRDARAPVDAGIGHGTRRDARAPVDAGTSPSATCFRGTSRPHEARPTRCATTGRSDAAQDAIPEPARAASTRGALRPVAAPATGHRERRVPCHRPRCRLFARQSGGLSHIHIEA